MVIIVMFSYSIVFMYVIYTGNYFWCPEGHWRESGRGLTTKNFWMTLCWSFPVCMGRNVLTCTLPARCLLMDTHSPCPWAPPIKHSALDGSKSSVVSLVIYVFLDTAKLQDIKPCDKNLSKCREILNFDQFCQTEHEMSFTIDNVLSLDCKSKVIWRYFDFMI